MKHIQNQLERFNQIQSVINQILHISLEPLTLEKQLEQILQLIISIPGLAVESKGAIFLVSKDEKYLELCVHNNLPRILITICSKVAFGTCLCGQAAQKKELVFSNCLDTDHHITYTGIPEHGHYCLPILSGDRILGVINLYLTHKHEHDMVEEEFLLAVTRTVAGIIERKRAEDALELSQYELRKIVGRQTSSDLFSPTLVKRFFTNWQNAVDSPCWPPPNLDHAKTILETVFVASLKKQEEEPVQISVTFIDPPSLLEEVTTQDCMTTIFAAPMAFSVESLVSLAPALDSISTSIMVTTSSETKNRLQIIGSVYFSHEGLHRFNAMDYALSPMDLFSVSTREAGNLMLFRGESAIGCFSSGELCDTTQPNFTQSPLAWNLLQVVQTHAEYAEYGMEYWESYRDLIDRLLLEASRRGHGGTILWLPSDRPLPDRKILDARFPIISAPEGSTLLHEFVKTDHKAKTHTSRGSRLSGRLKFLTNKRKLIELTEYLAQMACHDGALIISDRLQPLSFGSMFTAETWQGNVVTWHKDSEFFPSIQLNFAKRGMRHNSALNFVGQTPGSVAFVISQDGPIAGLTRKDKNSIYWWPDCLNKMWRETTTIP
ncbi:MAG: GAF domain-containing protein [Magnetococcales bacterium]|nr:GAF domain-containing protein [Magnetococcales bacterium]